MIESRNFDAIVVGSGQAGQAIAHAPAPLRATVAHAARGGYIDGLDTILLVGAVVAFTAAVLALALIRPRDFVTEPEAVPAGAEAVPA